MQSLPPLAGFGSGKGRVLLAECFHCEGPLGSAMSLWLSARGNDWAVVQPASANSLLAGCYRKFLVTGPVETTQIGIFSRLFKAQMSVDNNNNILSLTNHVQDFCSYSAAWPWPSQDAPCIWRCFRRVSISRAECFSRRGGCEFTTRPVPI